MHRTACVVLGWVLLTSASWAQNEPAAPAPDQDPAVVKIRLGGDRHAPGTVYYEFDAGWFWGDAPRVDHAGALPSGQPLKKSDDDGIGFYTRGRLGYVTPESLLPTWLAPRTRIELHTSYRDITVKSSGANFGLNDQLYAVDASGTSPMSPAGEFGGAGFFEDEHTIRTLETELRVVGQRDDGLSPLFGVSRQTQHQNFNSDANAPSPALWLNETLETDYTGFTCGGELRTPIAPQWSLILGTALTFYHASADLKAEQFTTTSGNPRSRDSKTFDSYRVISRAGIQYDSPDGIVRLSLFGEMDHYHDVPVIDNPNSISERATIGLTDMTTFAIVGRATFFIP